MKNFFAIFLLSVIGASAANVSGVITLLKVTNCCAEGVGSADGMIKVQLDGDATKTVYILPSAKNYKEMLANLIYSHSADQKVTIDFGIGNGQKVISQVQNGGVSFGVEK